MQRNNRKLHSKHRILCWTDFTLLPYSWLTDGIFLETFPKHIMHIQLNDYRYGVIWTLINLTDWLTLSSWNRSWVMTTTYYSYWINDIQLNSYSDGKMAGSPLNSLPLGGETDASVADSRGRRPPLTGCILEQIKIYHKNALFCIKF